MASGDGKVPIDESVRAAYQFMTSSVGVLFPAAALVAVFAAAGQVLTSPASPNSGLGAIVFAVALIGNIAFVAFVLRLALREDASGFFGLRLGADELRVGAVTAILYAIIALMLVVFVIVGSFLAATLAMQSGVTPDQVKTEAGAQEYLKSLLTGPAAPIFLLLIIAFFAGAAWLSIRFGVALPATIGERRIMMLSTFAWTKGNAFRILAANIIVAVPPFLATAIVASLISAVLGAVTGAASAASLSLPALFVVQFVTQLGVLVAVTPAQLGLFAYLYKGLRPPDLNGPASAS